MTEGVSCTSPLQRVQAVDVDGLAQAVDRDGQRQGDRSLGRGDRYHEDGEDLTVDRPRRGAEAVVLHFRPVGLEGDEDDDGADEAGERGYGRSVGNGGIVAGGARRQEDSEEHEDGDGAGGDEHPHHGDEVGRQGYVKAGDADEGEDEERHGVRRVADDGGHGGAAQGGQREEPEGDNY